MELNPRSSEGHAVMASNDRLAPPGNGEIEELGGRGQDSSRRRTNTVPTPDVEVVEETR